jgi:hypothetical protein
VLHQVFIIIIISYTEDVTNDEVCGRIEEQIGLFVDLLTAMAGA